MEEHLMKKKQLTGILLLSALGSTFSINKIFAGYEIGDKGVEVELALDYFKSHKIRSSEYWIYDDSVFNNPYDRVDFNILYNNQYDLTKLAQQGYRTVVIEATMDVKEVNHGYQYIYLFDDTSTNSYITGGQFDYGHNVLRTDYSSFTFYFEVPIFNLTNVLRYHATGFQEDTWANKELQIQVGLSTQSAKTSSIWLLQWTDSSHTTYSYQERPKANIG